MNMPIIPAPLNAQENKPAQQVDVRILTRHQLLALGPEWEELVENALEENAYFCRQYVEALLTHIDQTNVRALTIWRGENLIALLPFTQSRWHWGGIATLNMSWTTPYSMLSIPLIDKRDTDAAISGLVAALGNKTSDSNLWLFHDVTLDGPVGKSLVEELNRKNHPTMTLDAFDRAVLHRIGTFDTHMKEHVSKNRRKDLARNRRRLSELGTVRATHHNKGADLNKAVAEFLRIEASGWKGAQGTALDCTNATRAFAKQAFGEHQGNSITRADMLELDGKAIAISLSLQTGRTAFTIKCAYDETYRNYSAGLLLEEDMIRSVLEGDWADKLDSATAPGHLIQGLWNGSTRVGDILVGAGPTHLPFAFYCALEKYRRTARQKIKSLVHRLHR